jgi:two-component system, chemotaxis family, protein-glutamate methylesterase/glutaminase
MRSRAQGESVATILQGASDLDIVGISDGIDTGLAMLASLLPDIVLVENHPGLVDFTGGVKKASPKSGVILLSHSGAEDSPLGAQQIVDALASGAFDFAPVLGSPVSASQLLLSKIRCCSIKQFSRMAQSRPAMSKAVPIPPVTPPVVKTLHAHDAIVVGVSTGGPEALMEFLSMVDGSLPVPIIIVLHMPKEFTGAMATSLDRNCKIRVVEVQDGAVPVAGTAYLAQGGRHCRLERSAEGALRIRLDDGPAENGCRPAVDVLFRSAAQVLGKRALAVVLTGMGSDGTIGAQEMKRLGSMVLVQDEASSVVWGMPGSVVRAGIADEILPLSRIASRLREIVSGR